MKGKVRKELAAFRGCTHTQRMKKRERKQQLCRGLVSKVYINNARSVLEAGTPLWQLRYDRYLVVDGHAAGGVFLEDLGHPVGEPLILQLGLLLAVLLLVGESTCEMYSCCSTFGQGIHCNNKVSFFSPSHPPHTHTRTQMFPKSDGQNPSGSRPKYAECQGESA